MALGRSFAYCGYAESSDGLKRGIVVGGGLGVDGLPLETASTEIFDYRTNVWTSYIDLPEPRYGHCCVRISDDEDSFLISHGYGYAPVDVNYIYHASNETFTAIPSDKLLYLPACARVT